MSKDQQQCQKCFERELESEEQKNSNSASVACYAIETLNIEKYRLINLIKNIQFNEHSIMNNINHEEEKQRLADIEKAIQLLEME